ncbi:MAG: adenylate kinase [Planctomycetes bacterium]|nr:adenylate kinase [Planctomycetota bacterium]
MEPLQRVAIVGGSCAGKSTLARRLSETLEVPHIELDSLYWGPHWKENPPQEFQESVKGAVRGPSWICDGNYTGVHEIVWPRATTLLWLNYSFPLVFFRALRRTIGRVLNRTELYSGNRETFRQSFLSRQSILRWVIQTHGKRRKQTRELIHQGEYSHLNVVELRKPSETERFISRVCS